MSQTMLVVGATGMLGAKIVRALLNKEGVAVRILVRSMHPDKAESRERIRELQARGATVVEGELQNEASLRKACEGVTGVISAVQGGEEIIVAGQQKLLQAAEQAGVKRFIPSDFSFDYFKLDEGDNDNSDIRRKFATMLKGSQLEHTFVLNGAFTEVEFSPWGTLFDFQAGSFSYWGDGETPVDMTTTDDSALYVAEAVLDAGKANSILQVAGDTLTMKELLRTYEEVSGKRLQEKPMGSVEELKAWIEQKRKSGVGQNEYLPWQYHYGMVSGKAKLTSIENGRYPSIHPINVRRYLQTQRQEPER